MYGGLFPILTLGDCYVLLMPPVWDNERDSVKCLNIELDSMTLW